MTLPYYLVVSIRTIRSIKKKKMSLDEKERLAEAIDEAIINGAMTAEARRRWEAARCALWRLMAMGRWGERWLVALKRGRERRLEAAENDEWDE